MGGNSSRLGLCHLRRHRRHGVSIRKQFPPLESAQISVLAVSSRAARRISIPFIRVRGQVGINCAVNVLQRSGGGSGGGGGGGSAFMGKFPSRLTGDAGAVTDRPTNRQFPPTAASLRAEPA